MNFKDLYFQNENFVNGHSDIYKFKSAFGDKSSPLCVYNYGLDNTSALIHDKFYLGTKPTNFVGMQIGKPQFDEAKNDFSKRPLPTWNPYKEGIHILRSPKILPMFQ